MRFLLLSIIPIFVFLSYKDIKERKVPLLIALIAVCIAVVEAYFLYKSYTDMLYGAFTGVFLVICSRLTNAIGSGDGIVVIATGELLGLHRNMYMLLIAFVLAFIFMCIRLASIRTSGKSVPFIPFLTVSYSLMSFLLIFSLV